MTTADSNELTELGSLALAAAIRSGERPKLTGNEYVTMLLAMRQSEYEAVHPAPNSRLGRLPALIEWFVSGGRLGPQDSDDEELVDMSTVEPKPQPKRQPKPRVYKTAAELKEKRDKLQRRMDAIHDDDNGDNAIVNLSPFSRSKAARNAGRKRFAKMDNDLIKYTKLTDQIRGLNYRISAAEAREARTQGGQ